MLVVIMLLQSENIWNIRMKTNTKRTRLVDWLYKKRVVISFIND